jgi:hypothetical protein
MLAFSGKGPPEIFEFDLNVRKTLEDGLIWRGLLCTSGLQQGLVRAEGIGTVSTTCSRDFRMFFAICAISAQLQLLISSLFLHERLWRIRLRTIGEVPGVYT